jgi:hypothetical protein
VSATVAAPATADATRQPKGSYPKTAIPAAISHCPSGGWAALTGAAIPHTSGLVASRHAFWA